MLYSVQNVVVCFADVIFAFLPYKRDKAARRRVYNQIFGNAAAAQFLQLLVILLIGLLHVCFAPRVVIFAYSVPHAVKMPPQYHCSRILNTVVHRQHITRISAFLGLYNVVEVRIYKPLGEYPLTEYIPLIEYALVNALIPL